MRAIILAAGTGTRFNGTVKGLLKINNETLVGRIVRQLKENGLQSIYIVVGYHAEEFLTSPENVSLIYDKFFLEGRNSSSLKVALDTIGYDDTLMLDADIILTDDLIPKLLTSFGGESISLVDLSVQGEESMKLIITDGKIIKYSKEEGIGAEICSIVSKDKLKDIYSDLASEMYKWWGVGPNTTGFRFVNINENSKWMDIDTQKEYEQAKIIFKGC
ncbi:hypothetical protein A2995_00035 [Candidatus Nomurabacteria bacterium RIFCSPLOWO2_01_FULL_33_24]|uniref:MobA-like NTP transferase domain-containing protein n=1 Tax=Candidatus Nomurabacteria bacterium RIFCSPLOWO2_01_FULL_33_24 TaxID=1801765 RepID=A0A1F6X374_9BACT|nr:MAG: hypothetical protein A2995_00035 [Candidatus Nomurabacteria bacterium RIFCSPLOWO2_01_FULL_33_24]